MEIYKHKTIQNRPFINPILKLIKRLIFMVIFAFSYTLFSQQIADTTYNPKITTPEYKPGNGPVVFIDEGHFNFHTKNGRYSSFSRLLERDGYRANLTALN